MRLRNAQESFRILQRRYHRWWLFKNVLAAQVTNFIRCRLAIYRLHILQKEYYAARDIQCMYRIYRSRLEMWDRRCIGWEFMHQGMGPPRVLALVERYFGNGKLDSSALAKLDPKKANKSGGGGDVVVAATGQSGTGDGGGNSGGSVVGGQVVGGSITSGGAPPGTTPSSVHSGMPGEEGDDEEDEEARLYRRKQELVAKRLVDDERYKDLLKPPDDDPPLWLHKVRRWLRAKKNTITILKASPFLRGFGPERVLEWNAQSKWITITHSVAGTIASCYVL